MVSNRLLFGKLLNFCPVHSSLAVEYGEIGRIEEASNICKVVLASPCALAYPEWRETGSEIALRGYKSRSVISFKQQKPENLLYLPERERETYKRNPPSAQNRNQVSGLEKENGQRAKR